MSPRPPENFTRVGPRAWEEMRYIQTDAHGTEEPVRGYLSCTLRQGTSVITNVYLQYLSPFVDGNFLTTYILYRIFIKGIFMWDIICLEAKQHHLNSVGCVSSILFSQQHAQPVKQCIG